MFNVSPQELLLILVVALVVVGPQRLPGLGRSIGNGLRELRKAQDEVKKTIQVNLDEEPASARPSTRRRPHTPIAAAEDASSRGDDGDDLVAEGEAAAAAAGVTAGGTYPTAAETDPAVGEISRTLGKSLAELRRAREEIQRSFRVDLGSPPAPRPAPRAAPAPSPSPESEAPATASDEAPAG